MKTNADDKRLRDRQCSVGSVEKSPADGRAESLQADEYVVFPIEIGAKNPKLKYGRASNHGFRLIALHADLTGAACGSESNRIRGLV